MKILATIIASLILAAPASAAWHSTRRGDRPVLLTVAQAQRALFADGRLDHPNSVAVQDCQRLTPAAVRCHLIEISQQTNWTLDGQSLVVNADYLMNVRLINGHVAVALV